MCRKLLVVVVLAQVALVVAQYPPPPPPPSYLQDEVAAGGSVGASDDSAVPAYLLDETDLYSGQEQGAAATAALTYGDVYGTQAAVLVQDHTSYEAPPRTPAYLEDELNWAVDEKKERAAGGVRLPAAPAAPAPPSPPRRPGPPRGPVPHPPPPPPPPHGRPGPRGSEPPRGLATGYRPPPPPPAPPRFVMEALRQVDEGARAKPAQQPAGGEGAPPPLPRDFEEVVNKAAQVNGLAEGHLGGDGSAAANAEIVEMLKQGKLPPGLDERLQSALSDSVQDVLQGKLLSELQRVVGDLKADGKLAATAKQAAADQPSSPSE